METRAENASPTTIGIDIGKEVFHIVGFDADGKIAFRRKIKRLALSDTFPIKATVHEPINRPDTYERLPLSLHASLAKGSRSIHLGRKLPFD